MLQSISGLLLVTLLSAMVQERVSAGQHAQVGQMIERGIAAWAQEQQMPVTTLRERLVSAGR